MLREGRQTVDRTAFDLHVVRSTDNGVAYEDTIDHLSESEREVTGLVFALAGCLVNDFHEEVPFMLLDSLEAIDSDCIPVLVEYTAGYASSSWSCCWRRTHKHSPATITASRASDE